MRFSVSKIRQEMNPYKIMLGVKMKFELLPVNQEEMKQFKEDMQEAFQKGAESELYKMQKANSNKSEPEMGDLYSIL